MRKQPSVLFVIAEDWFFVSHFLPLATGIVKRGFDVGVLCRTSDPRLRDVIERSGIKVIGTASFREHNGLRGLIAQVTRIFRVMRREKPAIVHLISLRMIVVGGLAARLARIPVRVLALTGLGLLGAGPTLRSRLSLGAIGWLLRSVLAGPRTLYLFENDDDPAELGIDGRRTPMLVVGGAGIDPDRETVQPMPDVAPLRIAIVARMIFSKGITVAVDAIEKAREAGANVELTLVGAPDPGNPRSLEEEDLRAMAGRPGITWLGYSDDIAAIWRAHHVACVPSLGGEGLPRALLEAAAAGRGIVTTRTPGCARFVRDGIEGLLVPPGDPAALASAFVRLAADRALVDAMGRAARARVLDGFTIGHVAEAIAEQYNMMLRGSRRSAPAEASAPQIAGRD